MTTNSIFGPTRKAADPAEADPSVAAATEAPEADDADGPDDGNGDGGRGGRKGGRKGGRRGREGKAEGRGGEEGEPARVVIRPVARPARPRSRHYVILSSFVAAVVLPALLAGYYLWTRAVDQYDSVVGFSIRSEESRSTSDLLGQLSVLSGTSNADTDVLYEFIQSQELVQRVDAALGLRALYARHHGTDPIFSYDPEGSIEDLVDYWARMVVIAYDSATGLMEITAKAFTPEEAQAIAQAILDESILRINELSAVAREDATRYAREQLEASLGRLREAREAITDYRLRTQIVDPAADIQGQMGLLTTLQAQLAESLIELDLLRETARDSDPRVIQQERRIEVIRARIADERSRFGAGGQGPGGDNYAELVAGFERLTVDREFAEAAYVSARANYDAAVAAAQRNARYLAAHIKPTLAERARYPQRGLLFALGVLFLFLAWATAVLVYYSARDRR